MKVKALKTQATASRPIKALTMYPPNTPATLVPRVLSSAKASIKITFLCNTKLFSILKKLYKRITPTGLTEEERGFEQTKACYLTEEAEVDQNVVDRKHDEIERKNLLIAHDNLIVDCLSKEVFYVATNSELNVSRFTEMHDAHTIVEARCLELEAELSNLRDKIQNDNHNELVKRFSNLEVNHLNLQLKYQNLKESFGNNPSTPARDTPDFDSAFVIRKMKASLQGKDNVIKKLKTQISHLQETRSEADRTLDFRALDFQITQLTEKVTVLQEQNELFRAENGKIKQHYKELYDSIKITRAKHLEQTTALSTENENLKAQIQNKVKSVTNDHVKPTVLAPGKYAKDVEPIPPRNRNNRAVHLDYLRHLKESVETLREIVEEAKVERPLDRSIVYACRYTKHSQELLEYAIDTCPKDYNQRDKKKKQVTFKEQCNTQKHVEQLNTQKTNAPVPPSTRVNCCTDASGSQHRSNNKKNRISPAKGVNKMKVEEHHRINKSHLRTTNRIDSNSSFKHTLINSNSNSVCQTCNKCLISANHDMCAVDYLQSVKAPPSINNSHNVVRKVKQVWKPKQVRQVWKPTGKVLTSVGHIDHPLFIETVRFKNDHFGAILGYGDYGAIMGYGDYVVGDSVISRVYYVEGLGHNLFSVGQFCDSDLEVAFRKHSCYCQGSTVVRLLSIKMERTLVEGRSSDNAKSFKAPMFLWAEAVATACYTQNRSLIHTRHDKTPYELVHNKKPDLTFFRVFGALCYPTNDSENLGKLQPRADIGIFIGYAPSRKGYRIYNKRTRQIMETIHVQFDELTEQMAPVQSSPGPAPSLLTPGPISSGLVPNPAPAIPYDPIPNVVQDPVIPTGPSVSISIDLDAPSGSHISSPLDHHSSSVHHGVAGEQYAEVNPFAAADPEPFVNVFAPDPTSEASSSGEIMMPEPNQIHSTFINYPGKWTRLSSLLITIIGESLIRRFTRKQLATDALCCFYNSVLSKIEQKTSNLQLLKTAGFQVFTEESGIDRLVGNVIVAKDFVKEKVLILKNPCPGLQISQNPRGIFINQSKYANEILKKFDLHKSDPVDTPMVERTKLDENFRGPLLTRPIYLQHDWEAEYITMLVAVPKSYGCGLNYSDYGFAYNSHPFYCDTRVFIASAVTTTLATPGAPENDSNSILQRPWHKSVSKPETLKSLKVDQDEYGLASMLDEDGRCTGINLNKGTSDDVLAENGVTTDVVRSTWLDVWKLKINGVRITVLASDLTPQLDDIEKVGPHGSGGLSYGGKEDTSFQWRNCEHAVRKVTTSHEGNSTSTRMTNTIVTTPVNVTGAPVTNTVANHAEKPEKFNGQNFKRWQQKMFFYLGTLNLAWFLNETAPQLRMERLNLGNSPTANIKGKGDRQRDNTDLQDERQDRPKEEEVELRQSKMEIIEKSFGPNFVSFMVENEPTSNLEAIMDLPPGCKPLGYKWIFKKKMKANGTIDEYKARLKIKEFRQQEGLDYFVTYSTRITSVNMILDIAALRNLEVHQKLDVKRKF
ncbi:retrovirus-related pol polyprotein from transposon TNT 1-94 [Tanacetum coccineum]|uniref:Retrovirus-related pol polyprotein from transposon TNT 1-94 n=1 Tax=Tanacetum coccineum TaxID=301880 RepID=A0ABQ5BDZ1_9ASTR